MKNNKKCQSMYLLFLSDIFQNLVTFHFMNLVNFNAEFPTLAQNFRSDSTTRILPLARPLDRILPYR